MAPFDPHAMNRLYVDYGYLGIKHSFMVHVGGGIAPADAAATVRGFLVACGQLLSTSVQFSSARWSNAGSKLAFPSPWTAYTPPVGNPLPEVAKANFISFSGRTLAGRRCRLFLFGTHVTFPADYRLTRADNSLVGAAVDYLRANPTTFRGIDGAEVAWKDYVNFGMNAHYQRKLRS